MTFSLAQILIGNLDFDGKKRDSGNIMKSNFTRSLSLVLLLSFLSIGFILAGPPPALSAVAAVQIAQKDLDDRNLQGSVYISQLIYKSKLGGKAYWEVYWSKRFPANTEGYNEVGLHIKMDGDYTRTVKR